MDEGVEICDSCQAELDKDANFCPECGQGRGESEEVPGGWPPWWAGREWRPPEPERPRPRIFGAVLGALLVWTVILIVLVFFVYILATPVPA